MSKILLKDFDKDYYSSINGFDNICLDSKGFYNTIFLGEEKVGIVGFIPLKNNPREGFFQILIHPDYRGKGLLKSVLPVFVRNYNLLSLYATIKEDNTVSISLHKKLGFKKLSGEQLTFLRKNGFLRENELRFKKSFA